MGRTEKATKNILWSVIGKIVILLSSFLVRTIFILFLDKALLGINGLYTEILGLLSFAELGFGSAMSFSLYKPVAEENEEKIYVLLEYFKSVYRIIAGTVLVVGVALIPFLQDIVKGAESISLWELKLYYILFLINSVSSYFLMYKTAYVNAVQKSYIVSNYDTVLKVVTSILQIIALLIFRSYLVYLIIQIAASILSKFYLSQYLDHRFSIFSYKTNAKISKEDKQTILSEVKSLIVHQFASVAIYSTDSIIMSAIRHIGVVIVGLVSNYSLIITSVTGFAQLIFSNISHSFGNLAATEETKQVRNVFNQLELMGFIIYGFMFVCFFVLIPPFITLWVGKEFLIDRVSFFLIVLNSYLAGQSTVYHNMRITRGEFFRDKWLSFIQALLNLIVSIVAAWKFGLVGIYIGTVASRAFFVLGRPFLTYRFIFDSSVWEYYKRLGLHLGIVLVVGVIANSICGYILSEITWLRFFAAAGTCSAVSCLLLCLSVLKTREFSELFVRVKGVLGNVKKKQ